MFGFIIELLVVWVVPAVLGFAIKGLSWLAVIATVLFVIMGVFGFIRRRV